jgi:hypothetical protein
MQADPIIEYRKVGLRHRARRALVVRMAGALA